MTADDVNAMVKERLPFWRERLGLASWEIIVKVKRASDMPTRDSQGYCNPLRVHARAAISLIDPIDWPGDIDWPYDPEATLVHELLHCYFELENDDHAHLGLDLVARALVALARGGTDE